MKAADLLRHDSEMALHEGGCSIRIVICDGLDDRLVLGNGLLAPSREPNSSEQVLADWSDNWSHQHLEEGVTRRS